MSADTISVVICAHNGSKYLRAALDSVAIQQYPALEVIVVDDGSRDDSAAIAKEHPLRPSVVSQCAQGQNAAMNHGILLATGRLVAFIDHDDVWPTGRLQNMLDALGRAPEADAVYGKVVNTDSYLNPISEPVAVELAGAILIRRASMLRVGKFRTDLTHAGIVDWVSRARTIGLRFLPIDRIVLLRRIHGNNVGIRARSDARSDLMRVVRDHLRRTR